MTGATAMHTQQVSSWKSLNTIRLEYAAPWWTASLNLKDNIHSTRILLRKRAQTPMTHRESHQGHPSGAWGVLLATTALEKIAQRTREFLVSAAGTT